MIFSEPNSGAGAGITASPAMDDLTTEAMAKGIAAMTEKAAEYERKSNEQCGLGALPLAVEITKGMIVTGFLGTQCQYVPSGISPSGIRDRIKTLMKNVEEILKHVVKMNLKKQTKNDIYRTMRAFKDLLKRTSEDMQGMRIQAEKTWRILDDIGFLLDEDPPQENATPLIKSRVKDLTFELKEGSSQAITIAGLDQEWKTMQDRLNTCAKTVEAEVKGARDMWRVVIASAGSIAGTLCLVVAIGCTGGAAAVALGSAELALSVAYGAAAVAGASFGVGLRAATDKEFLDKVIMGKATQMSTAVLNGLEKLSMNAGNIDTLLHKLKKKNTELAGCLNAAESAQLRGCMEKFKELTADTKSVLSKHTDDIMECEAELEKLIETFDETVLPGAVKL